MVEEQLLAPCGTYCAVCPYRIAYINNDERLKEKLAKTIGIKPEEIICEGCNSDLPFGFCRVCPIKNCVIEKEFESCADCEEYPCKIIEKFPFQPFITRQKWDIKYRREFGKENWLEKTIEMNTCPNCKTLAHWKGRICKSCGNELEERYNS